MRQRTIRPATIIALVVILALIAAAALIVPRLFDTDRAEKAHQAEATTSAEQAERAQMVAWPAAQAEKPQIPKIKWGSCPEEYRGKNVQCAVVNLPLSYREVKGKKIRIEVGRIPAQAGKERRGSIFVNPGGPGESAISRLAKFRDVLGEKLSKYYDIVAVEPRGIGQKALARCWSTEEEPDVVNNSPDDSKEVTQWLKHDAYESRACTHSGQPLISHISTANVVRDMDVIRQSLGDEQFNYYGVSYGTVVGSSYAAMFPEKVGSMVLDGVVNPVDWATGGQHPELPVSLRTGVADSSLENLQSIIKSCQQAGPKRCPGAGTVAKEWGALIAKLRQGPVKVGEDTVSMNSLAFSIVALQYDPDDAQAIIDLIHHSYLRVVKGKKITTTPPQPSGDTKPPFDPYDDDDAAPTDAQTIPEEKLPPGVIVGTQKQPDEARWWDTFTQQGPMCADSLNPEDPQRWREIQDSDQAQQNPFVGVWLWNSSLCARWPGRDEDAFRGPFNVRTAHPLLIVGTTHDNATGYANAVSTQKLFPGSRLLTVDAFGHTAAKKSKCGYEAMRDYLFDGTLPPEGTRCQADRGLFAPQQKQQK